MWVKLSLQQAVEAATVCETSRFPHYLDNRLRDGGEVIGLARRLRFAPKEDSWYSFLLEAESNTWPSEAGSTVSWKKIWNDLIANRTRDLLACSMVT
jgi:hypothetical protein